MSSSPFELIAGPAHVYLAPVGTAFPLIDAVPAAPWADIGETEGGVMVKPKQTLVRFRTDQSINTRKIQRSEASMEITFNLVSLTLENMAKMWDDKDVTVVAAVPATSAGYHAIGVGFEVDMHQWSMLIRGPSPYEDANLQWEVPQAVMGSEPEMAFSRTDLAMLACTFEAVKDVNAIDNEHAFGTLRAQDGAQ